MASVSRSQDSSCHPLIGLCTRGPGGHPQCLCTSLSAFQSGRLRLRDLRSLGCLVFHSTDSEALSMVVSIILYWCVLSLIHSTNTYYFITRHLLNPGDTSPSLGGAHSLAEKSHSQIINSSQEFISGWFAIQKPDQQNKRQKLYNNLNRCRKKNPIPFQNKNIQQTRNKREPAQSDKGSTKKKKNHTQQKTRYFPL